MASGTEDSNREHWQSSARLVARRVNLAWWLETLSAPLLVVSLIGAAALLVVRREMALEPWIVAVSVVGALAALALACWLRAMRKFETAEQSLVRIEATMRLRNSLSTALAGVSPWPTPVRNIDAGLSWQWPRLLVPPLGALVLLAAGLFIPVTAREAGGDAAPDEPQAWKQLDAELTEMKEEELIDEKYIEETRKRLEELKAQEEEQWFSHSSMEATDSLKKSHQSESERVEREVGRAQKAMENLEKNAAAGTPAEKAKMMEEFDQALKGLQNGAMKPNAKLMEQMKEFGEKGTQGLTPEQQKQLRENLKKQAEAMKGEKGQGQGDDWSDELMGGDGEGEGEGKGKGKGKGKGDGEGDEEGEGEGLGKGGVSRGPGHDPHVLGKEKDGVEIGKMTPLEAKDLSKSTPGDLLELQDGEHDVDRSASGFTEGGGTDATGKGGDRVWKEALDPAEQRTLKKFFE